MLHSLRPFSGRLGLFDEFRKEMDSLFGHLPVCEGGGELPQTTVWNPRLNVSENEKEYEVTVDLPGMKPDEFDVELKHGDLWITGERKTDEQNQGKTWHRVERFYGQFRRVIRLGDDVDPENVDAECKDGVLHITVPKAEVARTKRIEVKC